MITRVKKNKKRRSSHSMTLAIFVGIVVLAGIGFLALSNWRIGQKRGELNKQIEGLREKIQVLEEKKTQLKAQISQSDQGVFWEKKIREQGYKKPGEEVAVILGPEDEETQEVKKSKGLLQKFLDKLKFW